MCNNNIKERLHHRLSEPVDVGEGSLPIVTLLPWSVYGYVIACKLLGLCFFAVWLGLTNSGGKITINFVIFQIFHSKKDI